MPVPPFLRALWRPPAVVALGVGVVLVALGWPLLGGLGLVAGAGLAWRATRGPDALLAEALRGLSVAMDAQVREQLAALLPALRAARTTSGIEQLGMQAHDQMLALLRSFVGFRAILRQRFSPGELTHGRYLHAGEQVFLAALDDLQRTAVQLQGLATVDIDQVRAQLRILERLDEPGAAQTRERETLRQRMALRDEEMDALKGLLASNEEALTQLSAAQAALARVQTTQGLAQLEASGAMQALEELSKRAERYAVD